MISLTETDPGGPGGPGAPGPEPGQNKYQNSQRKSCVLQTGVGNVQHRDLTLDVGDNSTGYVIHQGIF